MEGEYNKGGFSAVGPRRSRYTYVSPMTPPFGSAKSSYNLVIKNIPL